MSERPIRALERTLGTLRQLSRDGAQTLEQVTQTTGYPRSSLLRLLRSLEAVGAVSRDPIDRRYHARLRLVALAEGEESLRRRTSTAMRDLVSGCGQTVELYICDHGRMVMLERQDPEGGLGSVGARIGHPRPRDEIDAVVQVALASGDEDVVQPRRPYHVTVDGREALTAAQVTALIAEVKSAGVASDLTVNVNGVRRHAAALTHLDGRLAGALVVAQTDHQRAEAPLRKHLLEWARRLNASMVPERS